MAGNFENSYLGNIIGVQRQKMKDFTNSRLKKGKIDELESYIGF